MNKFTRSQMGKIMAYALSAAMAVTVVPTYMMKPLVAEAAVANDEKALGAGVVVTSGDTLTFNAPSYTGTTITPSPSTPISSVVNLYNKSTDTKPAYTLSETTTGKVVIGYNKVAAGNYYAEVASTYSGQNAESNTVTDVQKAAKVLIVVTESKASTGVSLTTDSTTVLFNETTPTNSNTSTLNFDIVGNDDATYSKLEYTVSTSRASAFTVTSSDGTKGTNNDGVLTVPTTAATPERYTDGETLSIKTGADVQEGDTLTVEANLYITGRTNPYKKTITFTARKGLEAITAVKSIATDRLVYAGETTAVSTTVTPSTSQEKVTYTIADTNNSVTATLMKDGLYYAHSGDVTAIDSDSDGVVDKSDNVYAIFNPTTGEFTTKKAGNYTITPVASVSTSTTGTPATVTAIELSFNNKGVKVGAADGTSNVTIAPSTVTGLYTASDVRASFTSDDPDIATVSGTQNATIKAVSAGITKINANIVLYADKEYRFEKSAYVVVAPKDDDAEFEITAVPDTELYANLLSDSTINLITPALSLQLGKAIAEDKVDAKVLSNSAYAAAESALANEYNLHYTVNASSIPFNADGLNATITGEGLLFAAYDPDVANVENPEAPVDVNLVISELQAKDEIYRVEDSVVSFVAEMTVGNESEVKELNKPVWLTVSNANLRPTTVYTVYDDGEAIYTAKTDASGDLKFQTDSFSVFSIVETPDATVTDNTAGLDKPDTPDTDDIYDKVNFSAHVQRRIGTDDEADIAATVSDDGIISLGTHGQSRRVEKITLTGLDADEVEMTAHVQKRVDHPEDVADLTQVVNEDGSISIGTEHQSRRIEAFSMNLKGDLAEKYDVYYRVHAQNYGWLGWAKNGEIAGTSGHSFRLEGIEIIFVEKGTEFDESQYVKTPEEGDRGYSEKAAYMDRVVSEK